MDSSVRILHLEDNDNDATLIEDTVRTLLPRATLIRVSNALDYQEALTYPPFDLILSDYNINGYYGLEALRLAQHHMPEAAFIFVTGSVGEELAIESMHLGATDCIQKHRLARLAPSIKRALAESEVLRKNRVASVLQRFQANILADVTDAVIVVSAEGTLTYWNDGAVSIFDCTRRQILGKPVSHLDRLGKRAPFSKLIAEVIKDGTLLKEISCQTSGGRKIWVLVKATLMKADIDNHIGCLLIAKDISERKLLEEERERSNVKLRKFDRFKSEFLSTASHEMRTPLTIIREFANLMSDQVAGPITQDQANCLLSILRNCDRMTLLLNDLLDLAKIESGRMHLNRGRLDVSRLLRESAADFKPQYDKKNQELVLEIEEDLPYVLGDRAKLGQALVNLIGNANKFTPSGGHIEVLAFRQDAGVCIEIRDDGQGINEEDLGIICDAFIQANREEGPGARGTGLGLTITRQIVRLHDGEIVIESKKGVGSTFRFSLPVHTAELEQSAFVADHMRDTGDGKARSSMVVVAVRTGKGAVPAVDVVRRTKASCDETMQLSRACDSISDNGIFVYTVAATPAAIKGEVRNLKATAIEKGLTLIVECEAIRPGASVACWDVALGRLMERAA